MFFYNIYVKKKAGLSGNFDISHKARILSVQVKVFPAQFDDRLSCIGKAGVHHYKIYHFAHNTQYDMISSSVATSTAPLVSSLFTISLSLFVNPECSAFWLYHIFSSEYPISASVMPDHPASALDTSLFCICRSVYVNEMNVVTKTRLFRLCCHCPGSCISSFASIR